jgi:hypothetical protein
MAGQGNRSKRRWTATCSIKESSPKGPAERLQSAVARLGPFRHLQHEEADRFVRPKNGIPVSEELAFERVHYLAVQFNQIESRNEEAPRVKTIVAHLNELEERVGELARFIETVDDFTFHLLQTAGSGNPIYPEFFPTDLRKEADVEGLPKPGRAPSGVNCRWLQRLSSLSQYAAQTRATFLLSKGIEDPDSPDKGGNANLHKDLYGAGRRQLVHEGWHLYETFKPGEAKGTEGSQFHSFLQDIFEYATGLEPEKHSKLMPWIKKLCKINRETKRLREQQNDLADELNMLSPTQANAAREAKIHQEHAELSARLFELDRTAADA